MRASASDPPGPGNRIEQVYLYDEPDALGLDIHYLGAYLAAVLPAVEVHPRSDFLTHHLGPYSEEQRARLGREILAQFDRARVATLAVTGGEEEAGEPEGVEEIEEVYDGRLLQELLEVLQPPEEAGPEGLHLVFTNWRLAVRGESGELHQAVSIFGSPTLVSLSGLFEALAAPRQYDFMRTQLAMFGLEEDLDGLDEQFAASLLGPGDPRLNEVLKGLALQALFSRMWGEAFCPDADCRLFNASTYEELLHAQTRPHAGLCRNHQDWLRGVEGAPERA